MAGLARLYTFLGSVRSYPLPVRAAAIVAGMTERDVVAAVNGTKGLSVNEDGKMINLREEKKVEKEGVCDDVDVRLMDMIYRMTGIGVICEDGHGAELFFEEEEQCRGSQRNQ